MGSGRTSGDLLRVVSWYLSRLLPRLRLSDPQQIRHASVGQSMIPRCRRAMASGLPPWTVIPACAQLRSAMWRARRPGLRSRMICRNSRSLVAARDSPRFGAPIEEVGPYRLADRGAGFEPSPLCPESSVSAAFRASVAANLHPYNAQFCTPASTEIR